MTEIPKIRNERGDISTDLTKKKKDYKEILTIIKLFG